MDVNLLVFASNEGSVEQPKAKAFLEERQSDPDLFCLTWPVLCGYQRIVTHPSIFRNPLDPGVVDVAAGIVADGGADVGGKGIEILEKFLGGLFLEIGMGGDRLVEVVVS